MITKQGKAAAISATAMHKKDVGSPAAQVAVLTARIHEITKHLEQAKHDFMARRGLLQMVGKRKKLLKQLEQKDFAIYKKVVDTFGLRK
jgi:small subunit ribosomal protein S15